MVSNLQNDLVLHIWKEILIFLFWTGKFVIRNFLSVQTH